ncbi:MAG: kelch repeat-containing protein, partial [Dehalococcoidia bacterium]|nr:kelch repeat-containing protein [Dehalococcoidia bacterium]
YDPVADVWSSAGETEVARAEHRATLLLDGRVLVTGGLGLLAESEIYDPVANEWSTGSPLEIGRFRHATVLLSDGRVVVMGGTGPDGILASSEVLASK